MKVSKFFVIGASSLGLLFLGACSSNQDVSNPSSLATPKTAAQSPESNSQGSTASDKHPQTSKGGQVIESGPYHMEFVPETEANGTHLDFYLQKGDNHTPIPNAKVMAQIQLPDGTQKSLALKYDAAGKHYTAMLAGKTAGEYKIVMLSNISGTNVNSRFNFKQ